MKRKELEQTVEEIITPICKERGLYLVDVEFIRERQASFLRVYIDKSTGVEVEDCQAVSEAVGRRLDDLDIIEGNYYLEVSSPGLDRQLKKPSDYQHFAGRLVDVHTYVPIDNKRHFRGTLLGLDGDVVRLRADGHDVRLPLSGIAKARLYPDFEGGVKG
ncbi:MAG: ribosome maturation factor RimP [Bacillota bacterium]